MRLTLISSLFLFAAACGGGSSNAKDMAVSTKDMAVAVTGDMAVAVTGDMAGLPTLVVNNTISWCTVTVTVGSEPAVMFSNDSDSFQAAEGTTVTLSATPNPGFFPVKWTGVTTMNGSSATYVMTSAASQMVTACCPTDSNGGGC